MKMRAKTQINGCITKGQIYEVEEDYPDKLEYKVFRFKGNTFIETVTEFFIDRNFERVE